jgi:hypothetical protein
MRAFTNDSDASKERQNSLREAASCADKTDAGAVTGSAERRALQRRDYVQRLRDAAGARVQRADVGNYR